MHMLQGDSMDKEIGPLSEEQLESETLQGY